MLAQEASLCDNDEHYFCSMIRPYLHVLCCVRRVHGGGGSGPVSRPVPALELHGGQGHVRALPVRRLPRQPEQLPHAGGLHQHLQRVTRSVPLYSPSSHTDGCNCWPTDLVYLTDVVQQKLPCTWHNEYVNWVHTQYQIILIRMFTTSLISSPSWIKLYIPSKWW